MFPLHWFWKPPDELLNSLRVEQTHWLKKSASWTGAVKTEAIIPAGVKRSVVALSLSKEKKNHLCCLAAFWHLSLWLSFTPFQLKVKHMPVLLPQLWGDCLQRPMKHLSNGFWKICTLLFTVCPSLWRVWEHYIQYWPRHPVSPHFWKQMIYIHVTSLSSIKSSSPAVPRENNRGNNL